MLAPLHQRNPISTQLVSSHGYWIEGSLKANGGDVIENT